MVRLEGQFFERTIFRSNLLTFDHVATNISPKPQEDTVKLDALAVVSVDGDEKHTT